MFVCVVSVCVFNHRTRASLCPADVNVSGAAQCPDTCTEDKETHVGPEFVKLATL